MHMNWVWHEFLKTYDVLTFADRGDAGIRRPQVHRPRQAAGRLGFRVHRTAHLMLAVCRLTTKHAPTSGAPYKFRCHVADVLGKVPPVPFPPYCARTLLSSSRSGRKPNRLYQLGSRVQTCGTGPGARSAAPGSWQQARITHYSGNVSAYEIAVCYFCSVKRKRACLPDIPSWGHSSPGCASGLGG